VKTIDYSYTIELNGMVQLAHPGSVYFVITGETADKIAVDTNIRLEIVDPMVREFYNAKSRLSVTIPVQ
jgi:hypothetical protein